MMDKKKLHFLIVNLITALRLAGIAVLAPVFLKFGGLAGSIVCMSCFTTDFFDGYLARKWKVTSFLGSALDGFADKAFGIVSLATLLSITKLAILPIIMELEIVSVNYLKYINNQNIKSNWSGKIKTFALSIGIVFTFLMSDVKVFPFLKNIPNYAKYLPLFAVMLGFEAKTLSDYTFDFIEQDTLKQKHKENDVNFDEKQRINEERAKLLKEKETLRQIKNPWTNHEFYEANKDGDNYQNKLRLVKSLKKERRNDNTL